MGEGGYAVKVRRSTKFIDALLGLRYAVEVEYKGRYCGMGFAGSLRGVRAAAFRVIMEDFLKRAIEKWETEFDFEKTR